MARAMECFIVILGCLFGNMGAGDSCQSNDLRAMAVMIRQIKTETHDTIEALRKEVHELSTRIKALENIDGGTQVQASKSASGFTAYNPSQNIGQQLTFKYVIGTANSDYDKLTGVFTCRTPGQYFFIVSLLRNYSHKDAVYCFIRKNAGNLVLAGTQLDSQKGSTAAVNSVYIHMDKGDTITLDGCTDINSFTQDRRSTFSGFLVTPDLV